MFGHDSIFTTFSDLFLVLFMVLIIKVRPPTGQSTHVLFTLLNLQVICNLALIRGDPHNILSLNRKQVLDRSSRYRFSSRPVLSSNCDVFSQIMAIYLKCPLYYPQ